jgi:phosphoglycolate phosphatase
VIGSPTIAANIWCHDARAQIAIQRNRLVSPARFVTPDILVLFDIDGTLLHTLGAGVRGMNRAFERLHGRPDAVEGVPVAGRTDRAIVIDGFRRIGIEARDAEILALRDAYLGELPGELRLVADRAPGVLPGVEATIDALERTSHVALGLLTGNFEPVAALKLGWYGLGDRFRFGGFGDHHVDRRDLLPMALDRARTSGVDPSRARVVVVGDTPLDIDCAHAHGAVALAVATGHYTAEQLTAAGADVVCESLGSAVAGHILALDTRSV